MKWAASAVIALFLGCLVLFMGFFGIGFLSYRSVEVVHPQVMERSLSVAQDPTDLKLVNPDSPEFSEDEFRTVDDLFESTAQAIPNQGAFMPVNPPYAQTASTGHSHSHTTHSRATGFMVIIPLLLLFLGLPILILVMIIKAISSGGRAKAQTTQHEAVMVQKILDKLETMEQRALNLESRLYPRS